QVVTLAGDVGRDLDLAGQLDTRDLPERRVRLLRSGGVHAGAYATALRAALEGRGLDLGDLVAATLAGQLLNGWHLPAFYLAVGALVQISGLCTAVLPRPSPPRRGVSHAVSARRFSVASWTCELARHPRPYNRRRKPPGTSNYDTRR